MSPFIRPPPACPNTPTAARSHLQASVEAVVLVRPELRAARNGITGVQSLDRQPLDIGFDADAPSPASRFYFPLTRNTATSASRFDIAVTFRRPARK
jgi:hypothetical protein